jgi:hypothetical protein
MKGIIADGRAKDRPGHFATVTITRGISEKIPRHVRIIRCNTNY